MKPVESPKNAYKKLTQYADTQNDDVYCSPQEIQQFAKFIEKQRIFNQKLQETYITPTKQTTPLQYTSPQTKKSPIKNTLNKDQQDFCYNISKVHIQFKHLNHPKFPTLYEMYYKRRFKLVLKQLIHSPKIQPKSTPKIHKPLTQDELNVLFPFKHHPRLKHKKNVSILKYE